MDHCWEWLLVGKMDSSLSPRVLPGTQFYSEERNVQMVLQITSAPSCNVPSCEKHPTDVKSRSAIFGHQKGPLIKQDLKAEGQRLHSRLWGEEVQLSPPGPGWTSGYSVRLCPLSALSSSFRWSNHGKTGKGKGERWQMCHREGWREVFGEDNVHRGVTSSRHVQRCFQLSRI